MSITSRWMGTLTEANVDAVLAAVDAGFEAQIALTRDLVRCPSLRGQEATAQDMMAGAFRAAGLDVDRFKIDIEAIRSLPGFSLVKISYDNAFNVVGASRGSVGGRSLILNGHIDVVPAGDPVRWTTPPFYPRLEDGWLYGRGAGDMKSGLVACLAAYQALSRAGLKAKGDLFIQSVVEEECTGNGALACLARGYRADCALIPEPFGPQLMRAQVGPVWFRYVIEGNPEHASGFQTNSANIIEKAFHIWEGLKQLEREWNVRARSDPHFHRHPHPLRFNLGKISGGDWPSSAPSSCTVEARCAVLPGWDLAVARAELVDAVARICRADPVLSNAPASVDFHGFMAEGYVLRDAEAQERVLAAAHARVFGEAMHEHVTPAATDGRFFGLYQETPALVYGPRCERAHGYDERVDLWSLRQVTKAIALFIAEWCGVAPA
jgi:acetylornithine deacetylase